MELNIYAIYDSKADAYLQPMFYRKHSEAIRAFGAAANDPQTAFYKNAEDFALFHLGSYDDHTGVVIPTSTPLHLVSAITVSKSHVEYYASFSLDKAV